MFINLIGMSPDTLTGFTFFVVNMALIAAALFFWMERDNVNPKWKTSLTVSFFSMFYCCYSLHLHEKCRWN